MPVAGDEYKVEVTKWYTIRQDSRTGDKAIECHVCKRKSWNQVDVSEKYCAFCCVFLPEEDKDE